ncbi:dihydropteroate synthase [Ohtaekwangia kribbensis]|jgi:dihydropteroate synthase|uniref:dihydropteroate synthase n=1 Tax=Ohtaekwangia kribbensis TaxID=688913 RepID=A0ABW3K2X4_9BACT
MTIPSMTGMKSSFENNFFSTNKTLNLNGRLVDLRTPRIMGILNVTPDSFYDGNRYTSEADILKQVEKMLSDGAMFIDVGGYSTRPGAEEISAEEEQKRVLKAVKNISHEFPDAFISVDTFRSEVVRAAVDAGAHLVNDVSGGSLDDAMFKTVAELKVPYILMHMRGTPQTMNKLTVYENLLKDIMDFFHEKIFTLQQLGAKDIIVDPGFGFAKTVEQNFELLSKLDHFNILGKPVLAGLSRKSMIWRTLDITPEEALNGTTSLNTVALLKGASLLRVHDVKQAAEAIKLIEKISTGHN